MRRMDLKVLTCAMVASACAGCSDSSGVSETPQAAVARQAAPSVAVVNAKVWTADPARPWAEAMAIAGERITLVGTSDEVRRVAGGAEIIDA